MTNRKNGRKWPNAFLHGQRTSKWPFFRNGQSGNPGFLYVFKESADCPLLSSFFVLDILLNRFSHALPGLCGVSRVWQAWHVPWTPLRRGRKNCMAKMKVCDLQFLESLVLRPMRPLNHKAASP